MGGLKRKIPMEKIGKKEKRSVAFSQRREGLFHKASELCLLFDAHLAILATPPSSRSNVSFYSFGHSSVDDVVDAFLDNRSPKASEGHGLSSFHALKRGRCGKKNGCLEGKKHCQGLGFMWEEEAFENSDKTEDLKDAIDEILKLKNEVNLRLEAMKDQEGSSADVLRDLERLLNEPEQDLQSPRVAEELHDFWVQCFCDNDAEDAFRDLRALLDEPQDSNQTQKISENGKILVNSEDQSPKNLVFWNYEACRDEEARAIEASSVCENRAEVPLDDKTFDDFLRDLSIGASQSLTGYENFEL